MIKCYICLKRFWDSQEYIDYAVTPGNCPKLANAPNDKRTELPCKTVSNVLSGFKQERDYFPQFLYPIIGPAESGKSYYLHTITKNLVKRPGQVSAELHDLRNLLRLLKLEIKSIHGYDFTYIRNLRSEMKQDRLAGTVEGDEVNNIPIVLECAYRNETKEESIADMCFFDLSGGHFHDNNDFILTDERMVHASGIIVFIDPTREKGFKTLARPNSKANPKILKNQTNTLIDKLSKLPRKNRLEDKIDIPIAFCVSMFDLIERLVEPIDYLQTSELYEHGQFNHAKIDNVSALIENLVEKNTDIDTAFITDKFLTYKWFNISTIGHDEISTRPGEIHPKGIYAPLLWLFSRNNLIR